MSETVSSGDTACPRCGQANGPLIKIEAGLRLRMQENGVNEAADSVCNKCIEQFTNKISAGATLRREIELKEQHRVALFKSRMNFVKQAKVLIGQKQFSEAAILYEKYLRILEMAFEVKPGELNPEKFSTSNRQQEMTVITGVFWDLLNIYDTSNRYGDRQAKVAIKLAEFARFTPLFASIVRQAEKKSRKSKNPEAFKLFLRESNARRPRCFVATSAFDYQRTETVIALCAFRDKRLRQTALGRSAIIIYENISPALARLLDDVPAAKPAVRALLNWLANRPFVKNCLKQSPKLIDCEMDGTSKLKQD